MNIVKTRWYSYKELCVIAKKEGKTGKYLCDNIGNGKKASGAYGCNIISKLN